MMNTPRPILSAALAFFAGSAWMRFIQVATDGSEPFWVKVATTIALIVTTTVVFSDVIATLAWNKAAKAAIKLSGPIWRALYKRGYMRVEIVKDGDQFRARDISGDDSGG